MMHSANLFPWSPLQLFAESHKNLCYDIKLWPIVIGCYRFTKLINNSAVCDICHAEKNTKLQCKAFLCTCHVSTEVKVHEHVLMDLFLDTALCQKMMETNLCLETNFEWHFDKIMKSESNPTTNIIWIDSQHLCVIPFQRWFGSLLWIEVSQIGSRCF